MARAIWSGYLTFGLVSLPVALYSATTEKTLHFNQFHRGTSHRIRYRKIDEVTGEEVASDEIESGYSFGDGSFTVVSREELRALAPERSEVIEITDFVGLYEIDPIFFRQAYYLAPRGRGSDRAYSLLRRAMKETNKVGIATLVLREKEHLVVVRHSEEVIVLETMYFADEIRQPREELASLPAEAEFKARELEVAKQLIDSLSTEWHPEQYKDTYRERIEQLVDERRKGEVLSVSTEKPRSNVVDLMAALEASLARTSKKRSANEAEYPGTGGNAEADQQRLEGIEQQGDPHLESMDRRDLVRRAAALGVKGRSKMTKAELIDALEQAQREIVRKRAS